MDESIDGIVAHQRCHGRQRAVGCWHVRQLALIRVSALLAETSLN
jgi:hypothetical protein